MFDPNDLAPPPFSHPQLPAPSSDDPIMLWIQVDGHVLRAPLSVTLEWRYGGYPVRATPERSAIIQATSFDDWWTFIQTTVQQWMREDAADLAA